MMKKLLITVLVSVFLCAGIAAAVILKAGDKAPDFKMTDQNGKTVELSQYLGKKNVVLYFYPKDFSKGCTAEACSFRDNYEVFLKKGAEVIGVSIDSAESHKKFSYSYKLPFVLISDPKAELAKKYGVDKIFGMLSRVTFIIDKKGVIRFVYTSMKDAVRHVDEAMKELERIDKLKSK
jgi:peroxiredoxin Q/BCP